MSNPNPILSNLTNMGKGRPKRATKTRIQWYLAPEVADQIRGLAKQQRLPEGYTAERLLRQALNMPEEQT